ncbi:uncharacterized protein DMENIID0001_031220 [Sergentomyia squamirostris]
MVTCKVDTLSKMNRTRRGSSSSSGFRLLGENCDTMSSISRNSIHKLKIDLMFDDSKSIISHRFDDRASVRDRKGSSIHGSSFRGSVCSSGRNREFSREYRESKRIGNVVQAQIERMFTDVAKDATSCNFSVRCLGALPLPNKVTSLQGLQEPLRQLYLSGAGHGNQNAGTMDICAKGLRVRLTNGREPMLTPFHNIAVWSAVKFVVSASEGGAAFLPLITDPENIDKSTLFRPLSAADKRRLSSSLHAPIFAVVMRSAGVPKQLECHAFVCQSPEDAIVIAATLYQSLMAHMGPSEKPRRPKNRNGVSCMSIASSSVTNKLSIAQKSVSHRSIPPPMRPPRKKRSATSSLSGESDAIREAIETETSTEERKKKSSKNKRAPPIPLSKEKPGEMYNSSMSYLNEQSKARASAAMPLPTSPEPPYQSQNNHDGSSGDILTRVAIPRSGSFLNTSGLTRYKSRATRRHAGKLGGGGGSPLGFSELFNEFRLQENLHSLDEILNAIINSDGMSFNDLKPIYKEFLLKLAVTLTKDELYQRSKSIMRRQKKKKLRRRNSNIQNQRKKMIVGAKGLKKVFRFGKFRSGKSKSGKNQSSATSQIKPPEPPKEIDTHLKTLKSERIRAGTSGSDVSETRNEHTMNAQNRNSSSGYVSCSECSYDSEACTCTSADRCYCSLGADHDHVSAKLACTGTKNSNRESLMTCRTEDKCYCSMGEGAESHTTWCDTDSCISASKCYCRRMSTGKGLQKCRGRRDNLALDYELFTVGDNADTEQRAQEALSVKKSVEMAAVFADVKLSQTTDISSLAQSQRERRTRCQRSNPAKSDFTSKSEMLTKNKELREKLAKRTVKSEGYYQPVNLRPVSTSLEDSLGYLP